MNQHPAYKFNFNYLYAGLLIEVSKKNVHMQRSDSGLEQFTYTQQCTFEANWNEFTTLARGLILDPDNKQIVGAAFPKFFNHGERVDDIIPDLPYEVTGKEDGSLIICYWHNDNWHCATKGSFYSVQAQAADLWLKQNVHFGLKTGWTYLFEWVSPENKIVISYHKPELILLSAYDNEGIEQEYLNLLQLCQQIGVRMVQKYYFEKFSDCILHASRLPANREGYVFKFENGYRLKIKGNEYKRIHALISHCTPLAIWEMMMNGDNLNSIRQDLPEEFWGDFDHIRALFISKVFKMCEQIYEEGNKTINMSDKEVGLQLDKYEPWIRSIIFQYRKQGISCLSDPRVRRRLFMNFRPTGNVIKGYKPSYAMNRINTMNEGE